jgi:hypothetical protein
LSIHPALVERLLADSAQGADALPLLALTLHRLYHDFGADGELSVAQHEAMGLVPGLLQHPGLFIEIHASERLVVRAEPENETVPSGSRVHPGWRRNPTPAHLMVAPEP